jgi:hypothetical protein
MPNLTNSPITLRLISIHTRDTEINLNIILKYIFSTSQKTYFVSFRRSNPLMHFRKRSGVYCENRIQRAKFRIFKNKALSTFVSVIAVLFLWPIPVAALPEA